MTETFLEWSEEGKSGIDVIKSLKLKEKRRQTPGEQAAVSLADKLATAGVQHNKSLPAGEQSLFDLLSLPKKVFGRQFKSLHLKGGM